MNEDNPNRQYFDISTQVEMVKAYCQLPRDIIQRTKRLVESMQKEAARKLKENAIARMLPIAATICDSYEDYFSSNGNKLSDSLCHLDLDILSGNKKREFDLFREELIRVEADIEQNRLYARHALDNLMEDISVCVNLQKEDYPETKDSISILRDVDYKYGIFKHPIPFSVHIYVFIIINCVIKISDDNNKAKAIQQDILDLFNNNDSETIETLKKKIEDQFKHHDEYKTLFQDIISAISQSEKNINENVWAGTNLLANKMNENETKKYFSKPKQDKIAEWIQLGFLEYCKNNYITFKTPGIPTIIKMMNQWNGYLKSKDTQKSKLEDSKPYPEYDTMLQGTESSIIRWGCDIFAPEYIKRKEMKKALRQSKKIDPLDRPHLGSDFIEEHLCSGNNDDDDDDKD